MRILTMTLLLVQVALPAHADRPEQLGAIKLQSSCQALSTNPSHNAADHCLHYLQGFLDATTTARTPESQDRSPFFDRALRTRAGSYLDNAGNPNERYCLPNSTRISELAGIIVGTELDAKRDVDAQALMKYLLRKNYPCR